MTSRYEGRELLRRDLRQPADYFANLSFNRTCHGRRLWPGAEARRAFSGTGPKPPAASRRLTLR
jgi:hypothetical protein